ncbi:MAG TPA: ABC transporter permease [Dehalococcoidia bacterium]|nr:ABC transporter permease [Dehalococcoidia bacterium]
MISQTGEMEVTYPRIAQPNLALRSLRSLWRFVRTKPLGAIGGFFVLLLVFSALTAEFISPYDPLTQVPQDRLQGPSWDHWLGTDQLGRDQLSRIIHGSRTSLFVGFIAVGLGTLGGTIVGLVSGYLGGLVDLILQRVMDAFQAFPAIVLALALISVLGTGIENVMLAIGIVIMPGAGRIVRGAVLAQKANLYVEAARTIGCSQTRILVRHILPNVAAPIIVIVSIQLGTAILAEASLTFLGLGTQPPDPSWGLMLSSATQRFMVIQPWMAIAPGIAISLAVFGFNLFGDAIRDVLDPRLRGT